jgi:hypothetical protein
MGYLVGMMMLSMAVAGVFGRLWWTARMRSLRWFRDMNMFYVELVALRNELRQIREESYVRALLKVEENAGKIARSKDFDDSRSMKWMNRVNYAFARGTASLCAFTDAQVLALADHGWMRIMTARRDAEERGGQQSGPQLREVKSS